LVGGLYVTCIGQFFATESQFHRVRDTSKVAFFATFETLQAAGFVIHDVPFQAKFLKQFGSTLVACDKFCKLQMESILHRAEFRFHDRLEAL